MMGRWRSPPSRRASATSPDTSDDRSLHSSDAARWRSRLGVRIARSARAPSSRCTASARRPTATNPAASRSNARRRVSSSGAAWNAASATRSPSAWDPPRSRTRASETWIGTTAGSLAGNRAIAARYHTAAARGATSATRAPAAARVWAAATSWPAVVCRVCRATSSTSPPSAGVRVSKASAARPCSRRRAAGPMSSYTASRTMAWSNRNPASSSTTTPACRSTSKAVAAGSTARPDTVASRSIPSRGTVPSTAAADATARASAPRLKRRCRTAVETRRGSVIAVGVDDIDRLARVDEVAGPRHRVEELDHEERRTAGAILQQLHEPRRRPAGGALLDQLRQLVVIEVTEDDGSQEVHTGELGEAGVDVHRDGRRRPGRRDDEHACLSDRPHQVHERRRRVRIGVVEIVDTEQDRRPERPPVQHPLHAGRAADRSAPVGGAPARRRARPPPRAARDRARRTTGDRVPGGSPRAGHRRRPGRR